jgi:hypothetical protein
MKHVKIKASDIHIDPRYQREVDARRVAAIAKGLDWSRIGVPDVSLRADGTFWCIDGQHRVCAIVEAGAGDTAVLCSLHEGLSMKDEAALFLELNGARTAVGVHAKFKAALVAKDPTACEIDRIVRSHGLQVAKAQAWKSICVIQAMQYSHGSNGNLSDVLGILVKWEAHTRDKDLNVFEGVFVRSVSDFLALFNGSVDRRHFQKRLDAYEPDRLMRAIRRSQDANVGIQPKWVSACEILRQAYNVKAKSKLRAANVVATEPAEKAA